jgi:hypothetical protein
MSMITKDKKDGSHIEFFHKEDIMFCAKELVRLQELNPTLLNGVKLPKGLAISGGIKTLDYTVTYYGIKVGVINMMDFHITYSD